MDVGAISEYKQSQIQQQFQVAVLKKAIDSGGQTALKLIDTAGQSAPTPPGVGEKLNVVA